MCKCLGDLRVMVDGRWSLRILKLPAKPDLYAQGGTDNNLDYMEVVHVFLQRSNSSRQALYKAG